MRLSLKPQTISDTAWYYEEGRGIDVIVEHRAADGSLIGGEPLHVRIPWSKLEASVLRKHEDRAAKAGAVTRGTRSKSRGADTGRRGA